MKNISSPFLLMCNDINLVSGFISLPFLSAKEYVNILPGEISANKLPSFVSLIL